MPVLLLAALLLWGGCQDTPPGALRAATGEPPAYGSPDTVQARLLAWEMPMGAFRFEPLDSTEQAWLERRDYVLVDWRVDSSATYYYRQQAQRRPRWNRRTLMTERLYAPRDPDADQGGRVALGRGGGTWGIAVGTMTDPTAARSLMQRYRKGFSEAQLSVDMTPVSKGDSTLYRVVVGTFDSVAVRQALDRYAPKLPAGAWPVRRQ